MVAMRATVGWRCDGAMAAWAVPPLLIAGLLFILCTVDVSGGPVRHDGECSIEEAAVAVGTAAPAPATFAIGGVSVPNVVVPRRWFGIDVSPTARLQTHRRSPQQPRAPPSLAIT